MSTLRDELLRTLSAEGSVSVRVLSATNLVREASYRHAASPAASVVLGRALMGTLLLATETQDGESVQLRVRGDGPLGAVTVTANSDGTVRGFVSNARENPPLGGDNLGVAQAIGLGTIAVERNHPCWKQPYSGTLPLVESEIAQDLAHYLLESEQKPSAIALGIYLGVDGQIEAAGGYLIQSLPGADDASLADVERRVARTLHPSEMVRAGVSADSILERLLAGLGTRKITRIEPRFRCTCSRERVRQACILLGRDEIRDIVRRAETVEVRCAFCAEIYRLAADEVGSILADA